VTKRTAKLIINSLEYIKKSKSKYLEIFESKILYIRISKILVIIKLITSWIEKNSNFILIVIQDFNYYI
jgi:hypothetical protein